MSNEEERPSNDGLSLVRCWRNGQRAEAHAKEVAANAKADRQRAEQAIVSWLVPEDAEVGQVYMLPVGNVFLRAEVKLGDPIRQSGRSTQEARVELRWHPREPEEL